MPDVKITRKDWTKLLDIVYKKAGKRVPIWKALFDYYNVCVFSLVSNLSITLWELYRRVNGTKNENFESYRKLPAIYVDACNVIDLELDRIRKIQEETQDGSNTRTKRKI